MSLFSLTAKLTNQNMFDVKKTQMLHVWFFGSKVLVNKEKGLSTFQVAMALASFGLSTRDFIAKNGIFLKSLTVE